MPRQGGKKGDNAPRPILLRREEVQAAPHHGGAWKIAYADFVTAMMAFFLVMWLINAVTEDKRRGIASFFNPLAEDTVQPVNTMLPVDPAPLSRTQASGKRDKSETNLTENISESQSQSSPVSGRPTDLMVQAAKADRAPLHDDTQRPSSKEVVGHPAGSKRVTPGDASSAGASAARDRSVRAQAEAVRQEINHVLEQNPALRATIGQVRVSTGSDEIRISIEDNDRQPMFARGSIALDPHAIGLLKSIAPVIIAMPGELSIAGYTDAAAYRPGQINNWTLSAMRADAARETLVKAGFPDWRLRSVTGHAEHELANPEQPLAAGNRRIVLTMIRKIEPDPVPASSLPTSNVK
ncbi:flagellar motor protein MotB [Brytella acorum]|uniref:OmpA family protein n=1 Tax=Brytella acorum TaxID=2959299 RepID=A0AA35Y1I1_9PROT|nr:flagellar motor protein MotB [Brytella acorum]MDF3624141.1 flagellar motor protein MotB [Brytella acorum]CAI9120647.1 OmpA family protein [Brytella acorum]